MNKVFAKFSSLLLSLLVFSIPIEHKYDKPLRHLSLSLLPDGLLLPRGFDKKIYFYLSDFAALVLLALLLFAFRVPLRRLFMEKGLPFLWAVFVCAALSLLFSPLSHYPVVYTRLLQLLTPILLFAFLAHSGNSTRLIFSVLIAAALVQSAIAIAQYFAQAPLGLRLLNEPQGQTGIFPIEGGNRWIFDRIFHRSSPWPFVVRACGTLPHCNVFGGFMALSLLATYSFLASTSKRWLRRLLGLSLPVQFFAMNIAYSRAAIFGWALGTIAWFGYSIYSRGLKEFVRDKAVRFLAAMIAVSAAVSGALLFDQHLHRGGVVNYNAFAKGSDQVRIDAQNIALKIIEEHPLLGVGYQQFARGAAAHLPPGTKPDGTHNIYLFLAAETGLISLAAFLGFLLFLLIKAVRAPFSPRLASLLAILLAFLFIGACDFYLILFQQGKLMLFTIAGLLAAESYRETTRTVRLSVLPAL